MGLRSREKTSRSLPSGSDDRSSRSAFTGRPRRARSYVCATKILVVIVLYIYAYAFGRSEGWQAYAGDNALVLLTVRVAPPWKMHALFTMILNHHDRHRTPQHQLMHRSDSRPYHLPSTHCPWCPCCHHPPWPCPSQLFFGRTHRGSWLEFG